MEIKRIKARFICALSISYLDKNLICVRGEVDGHLSDIPKGNNGFGYDPIFIPREKKKLLEKWSHHKNIKLTIDLKHLKNLKNFYKFAIINFVKI